ncbi:MAG: DUF362 domain-containing protein [Planctomycetota bacterium]|nr:DUF362 domain-containing protein [Planctomycetota bacterium]
MRRGIVSMVACPDYDPGRVRDAVERAVELIGGWDRFLPAATRVIVKPNLLTAGFGERPAATHPAVVRAVVEAIRTTGRGAFVFDRPGYGSLRGVARTLGIGDLLLPFEPPPARLESRLGHFGAIERADFDGAPIVNVPKLKTHGMMGLTLAVKNMFGLVGLARRVEWHLKAGTRYDHFAGLLVEIERGARPALNIMDAVVGMEGNGPASGTARRIGCIMASADALAMDATACRLVGWPPERLKVLEAARRLGVEFDIAPETEGGRPEDFAARGFRFASMPGADPARPLSVPGPGPVRELVRRWSLDRPALDQRRCVGCGRCVEVCPAKAISMRGGSPAFDLRACIRCFCCQEMCPEGAISVKRGILGFFRRDGVR